MHHIRGGSAAAIAHHKMPRPCVEMLVHQYIDKDALGPYIATMNDTYYVSDLARIAARVASFPEKPAQRDIDVAIRRLRGWTLAGALAPIGDPHAGTGRHREYDRSAVYLVAVLNVLADNNLAIGPILEISRLVRNVPGPTPLLAGNTLDLWNKALAGGDVFIVMTDGPRIRGGKTTVADLVSGDKLQETMHRCLGGIFINLTAIFSRLPQ